MPPVDNGVSAGGSAARRWDPIQEARQESLKTPEDNLRDEINKVLAARLESVRGEVNAWLSDSNVFEQIVSRNHPTENRPLTDREFQGKLEKALADKSEEIKSTIASPLFTDINSMITGAGLSLSTSPTDPSGIDPAELEKSCLRQLTSQIDATVREVFKEKQSAKVNAELEEKDEFFKKISEIPGGKLTPEQVDEWIRLAARDLSKNERQRLVDTGLVELEGCNPGPRTLPETFKRLRNLSNLLWAPTLALGGWGAWSLANCSAVDSWTLGIALSAGAASLVNKVAQEYLSMSFENRMKNTWKEAKTELNVVDVVRGVAWAGVMYKLVSQYSPLYLAKDSTDLFNSGRPASVAALLDHLKLAACVGVDAQMNKEGDRYYKGVNFKDKVVLAEEGLKHLEARWLSGWQKSEKIAGSVAVVACGLAFSTWASWVR